MDTKIPTKKSKDKSLWSRLRKAQYVFMKESLNQKFEGVTMLDIGSGASQFEDLYKSFKKTAIDFAPYEGTDIIHDLEKGLPFENDVYDIVVSTNTFEHIYTVKDLISECYRVTKKGGFLIGSTPFQLCVHQEPYDYFRYTPFALERMMSDAGYSDIVIVSLGTHNQLVEQTVDHFFASQQNIKNSFLVRILWKLSKILQKITILVLGESTTSRKHTLGYGFIAKKLK